MFRVTAATKTPSAVDRAKHITPAAALENTIARARPGEKQPRGGRTRPGELFRYHGFVSALHVIIGRLAAHLVWYAERESPVRKSDTRQTKHKATAAETVHACALPARDDHDGADRSRSPREGAPSDRRDPSNPRIMLAPTTPICVRFEMGAGEFVTGRRSEGGGGGATLHLGEFLTGVHPRWYGEAHSHSSLASFYSRKVVQRETASRLNSGTNVKTKRDNRGNSQVSPRNARRSLERSAQKGRYLSQAERPSVSLSYGRTERPTESLDAGREPG